MKNYYLQMKIYKFLTIIVFTVLSLLPRKILSIAITGRLRSGPTPSNFPQPVPQHSPPVLSLSAVAEPETFSHRFFTNTFIDETDVLLELGGLTAASKVNAGLQPDIPVPAQLNPNRHFFVDRNQLMSFADKLANQLTNGLPNLNYNNDFSYVQLEPEFGSKEPFMRNHRIDKNNDKNGFNSALKSRVEMTGRDGKMDDSSSFGDTFSQASFGNSFMGNLGKLRPLYREPLWG